MNAYALYENYETLDIFITIYKVDSDVMPVTKAEADKSIG